MTATAEDFRSGGALPSGPVSAWPKSRHEKMLGQARANNDPIVKASTKDMAKGLLKTAGQALRSGRVSPEVREERMATCRKCPSYRRSDKRCGECGCFMEAKSWVGGDPDRLCPLQKWAH